MAGSGPLGKCGALVATGHENPTHTCIYHFFKCERQRKVGPFGRCGALWIGYIEGMLAAD